MNDSIQTPSKEEQRRIFIWLWQNYLSHHKVMLGIGFFLMTIEGSMLGLLAYMLQPMFDNIFIAGQQDMIWTVAGAIMALFVVRATTSVSHKVVFTTIARKAIAKLQNDLLAHLMRLDMAFFSLNPPGYLIERVHGDVQALNQIWAAFVRGAGRDTVALIALFTVAISIDWRWTLIGLFGAPLLLAPSLIAQRYTKKQANRARDVAAHMATRLDEVFHGIASIKLNGLEDYNNRRYHGLTDHQVQVEVKTKFGSALIPALVDIMSGLGFVAVIIYGGYEIINGTKTVGQFMSFFTAMGLAFEPMRRLASLAGLVNAASVSVTRMRGILKTEPKLTAPANPVGLPAQGDIQFDAVHLDYGNLPVLRGLSFQAEAGKTTAIVGQSGAGKSTVFNVLSRLVDPNSGAVTLGGVSNQAVSPTDLRQAISVVSQETILFDDSIRENILLGRTDVSEAQLQAVLDAAYVSEFAKGLPQGLDSPVGPRGSSLSGGQRQRIAIARALLRDTPILLLDEATSALDTHSEVLVQNALQELSQGRTTLVIAHRLSTIRHADKIIVLEAGRLVEEGTHSELMAKEGAYAELCRLQFSEKDDSDAA